MFQSDTTLCFWWLLLVVWWKFWSSSQSAEARRCEWWVLGIANGTRRRGWRGLSDRRCRLFLPSFLSLPARQRAAFRAVAIASFHVLSLLRW